MSNTNQVVEEQEPITEPTPQGDEKSYIIAAPKDDQGRAFGADQVIKYRTEQELIDKIANNWQNAQKHIRKLNADIKLGIAQPNVIPDTAIRAHDEAYDFQPRELTADEKFEIVRNLQDPETFDAALDKALEAKLGAKPEVVRNSLSASQTRILRLYVQGQAQAFMNETPEYVACPDNETAIFTWIRNNKLEPNKENFALAFSTLKDSALILSAPTAAEDTPENTHPESEPEGRITQPETTQQRRPSRAPTSLNRNNSSPGSSAFVSRRGFPTKAEIDAMSSTKYLEYLRKPGFSEYVDSLR